MDEYAARLGVDRDQLKGIVMAAMRVMGLRRYPRLPRLTWNRLVLQMPTLVTNPGDMPSSSVISWLNPLDRQICRVRLAPGLWDLIATHGRHSIIPLMSVC